MSVNHICLEIPPLSAALRPRRCSAIAPCAAPRGARRCSCCGPCWKNGCAMFLAALLEISYGDDMWIPGVFRNSDVQLVLEVRNSWGCISTCHEYNPLLGVENHLHLRSLTEQQVSSSWWLNKGLLILSSDQWRCWKTWQVGWQVNCTNKVLIFLDYSRRMHWQHIRPLKRCWGGFLQCYYRGIMAAARGGWIRGP